MSELEAQGDGSCAQALGERLAADDEATAEAEEVAVAEVNVGGDVATVTLEGGPGGTLTQQWRREGGEWRLALSGS